MMRQGRINARMIAKRCPHCLKYQETGAKQRRKHIKECVKNPENKGAIKTE